MEQRQICAARCSGNALTIAGPPFHLSGPRDKMPRAAVHRKTLCRGTPREIGAPAPPCDPLTGPPRLRPLDDQIAEVTRRPLFLHLNAKDDNAGESVGEARPPA